MANTYNFTFQLNKSYRPGLGLAESWQGSLKLESRVIQPPSEPLPVRESPPPRQLTCSEGSFLYYKLLPLPGVPASLPLSRGLGIAEV